MAFLISSHYFELTASILTGHVLTSFSIKDAKNATEISNYYVPQKVCKYILKCDGSVDNIRKSIILSFIIVKILQSFLYVTNVYIHHNACDERNSDLKTKAFTHVLSLD